MPLTIKNAPDESFNAFQNNAHSFHKGDIRTDEKGDHHHYIPHKVYTANATDLAAGKGLSKMVQTGWRYVFEDANGTSHVAEIGIDETLDEHAFHHVNVGSHVNNFVKNYKSLQEHSFVNEKDYEINILRIPSIYVMAIWLKGQGHDHEFFVPIAPVNSKFEADKTYEYDAFVKLLQEAAREMVGEPLTSVTDDDLARIEGIGPKIAEILRNAGYTTFKSLAAASVGDLDEILKAAGAPYNMSDPTTWPEQAKLADEGNWDELEILQEKLQGGKRK